MHRNKSNSFIKSGIVLKFMLVFCCCTATLAKTKKKKRFCSGVLFDIGNVQYQCSFIRGYLLCNHPKYNTESTSVTLVNMCAIKGAYNRYPNIVS